MATGDVLPSGLRSVPAAGETLARALFSDNQFNTYGPKFTAFMPAQNDETSVFRDCAHDTALLRAACDEAAFGHGKLAKHVAMTTVAQVLDAGLSVLASEPPARHANIVGWPRHTDPERQKADRKLLAMRIAASARLMAAP